MAPSWLDTIAAIWLGLSVLTALYVLADIFLLGNRQKMTIMEAVWPLTMLYWGPLGLPFYWRIGRAATDRKSFWQIVFGGATHCGAGCALGDFIGDWLVFLTGFALLGSVLAGKYLAAFILAYVFGIAFQYFSIAPMRGLGPRDGIIAAIKVDTLSLIAYEVGMFGFMAFRSLWLFPALEPTSATYWLMMQVAMLAGFATTYPVNWWLIRSGVKEAM